MQHTYKLKLFFSPSSPKSYNKLPLDVPLGVGLFQGALIARCEIFLSVCVWDVILCLLPAICGMVVVVCLVLPCYSFQASFCPISSHGGHRMAPKLWRMCTLLHSPALIISISHNMVKHTVSPIRHVHPAPLSKAYILCPALADVIADSHFS